MHICHPSGFLYTLSKLTSFVSFNKKNVYKLKRKKCGSTQSFAAHLINYLYTLSIMKFLKYKKKWCRCKSFLSLLLVSVTTDTIACRCKVVVTVQWGVSTCLPCLNKKNFFLLVFMLHSTQNAEMHVYCAAEGFETIMAGNMECNKNVILIDIL